MLFPSQTALTSSFSLTRAIQVINVCSDQRLLDSLRDCNKLLDMVQKGLSKYLETKRSAFPRWAPLAHAYSVSACPRGWGPSAPPGWGAGMSVVLGQLGPSGCLTHSLTPVPLADSISCLMMSYSRSCPRRRTPQLCSPTYASALRTSPRWVTGPRAQGQEHWGTFPGSTPLLSPQVSLAGNEVASEIPGS